MKPSTIQTAQLNEKLKHFKHLSEITRPEAGWVKTIRTSLGISLEQLGAKLGVTRQSAQNLEKRESEGAITIRALEDAARALDMKLVYGFVPIDGSIEKMIDRKASQLAEEIVMRTSRTMALEDQEISQKRLKKAIAERKSEIIEELPKILWD